MKAGAVDFLEKPLQERRSARSDQSRRRAQPEFIGRIN